MVGIVVGDKGSGKTKQIINDVCISLKEVKGSVVFIDADNSQMYALPSAVRFINAADYNIKSSKMLYGMICGVAAQDFDLERIYVDSFKSFVHHPLQDLKPFFDAILAFSEKHHVDFVFSINEKKEELPEYLQEMVIA